MGYFLFLNLNLNKKINPGSHLIIVNKMKEPTMMRRKKNLNNRTLWSERRVIPKATFQNKYFATSVILTIFQV